MKKIIFTLLIAFGFFAAQASYESHTFDPDSLCSVTFDTIQGGFCAQANPTGTAPFAFLWSDSTTQNFACFNSPGEQLCVIITDATGCVVTACTGGIVTNNCGVDVYANYISNNTSAILNAYAWGDSSQAYTYLWSTGETSHNITVNSSGNYCVTIVDASNCEATDCVNVNLASTNNCSVYIDTISGNSCLTAVASGVSPFTYQWSTGDPNQTICSFNPMIDTLCVTVTDASGCVSTACTVVGGNSNNCGVFIDAFYSANNTEANLYAYPYGDSTSFSYTWSTGAATDNINVTLSGNYCVTIVDGSNCIATQCINITINTPPACSVTLNPVQGSNCLTANATGVAPFTFQWSNGELTQTACSNNPGIDSLCVTITDANGCASTACGVVGNGINCNVWVSSTTTGLTAMTNDSLGNYTYQWSSGENTPSIIPTATGTYCVTITTPGGCMATGCGSFSLMDEISGFVFMDSINSGNLGVNTHKIYLIQHDAGAGTLTAVDSQLVTTTPNNWGATFAFTGVAAGDYLVKVALEPGSDSYASFLPTYYGASLFWDEATTATSPGANTNIYIDMIMGTNPGGPGFIGGLISEGANIVAGQAQVRGEGDPIANVSVLLLTDLDEPIAHTVTDMNGEFEFPSVAYGTYKVIAEVLGKDQGIKIITLSPENPTTTVDFEVNDEYVTKIEDVLNGASLKLFPNPVTATLNVQIEMRQSVDLNISVVNLLGETVFSNTQQLAEGIQTMGINLKNLPQGIYFLNLSDGQEILSQKIMKQ